MEKSEYISSKLNIPTSKIDSALDLFSQGATVPFVARYRREVTGGLEVSLTSCRTEKRLF